ncbi:MAG TPA: hypothetical protein VEC39_01770, partial [Vicinamibacterales bacterium]|nr:hypothetical protein [Vicinamibacterales bacterium]
LHAPPVFEGFVDTPPMQNAPLFDDWMTNESPYENAYAAIGADDDEQRRKYLDQVWQAYNQALQSQTAPRPANPPGPSWNWNAGNTPTNGGTNA